MTREEAISIMNVIVHMLEPQYDIKQYIYKTYGYDPGGCTDGQISLDDMQEVSE